MIAETEAQIKEEQLNVDTVNAELRELLETSEGLKLEYDRLLSWADLYDKSSFEAKKIIVSQFIQAVRIGRDYNIEIDFNVSFEEFQSFRNEESAGENLTTLRSHTA